ncbi:MAG: zinc dependent phospholipase C family protein [Coriobacteriales bacterium]|nr:zinc dependent phospholipase C family protein [Coriobacteriales bacterium]
MPAVITHHIFGEDASRLLPDELLSSEEELLAFLLGNQGPDPLWARARTLPWRALPCHRLASAMHATKTVESLLVARKTTTRVREDDKGIARAFCLGLAAHYLLDSFVHPLVYAQQRALMEAGEDLADAGSEIHAIIESDIDSWMLWQKRQKTVLDSPASSALVTTERINHIVGALMAQVGWKVYGIEIGTLEYGHAVGDYQLLYRLIDPPATRIPRLLSTAERVVRPHSKFMALTHRVTCSDECESANLDHVAWRDPESGAISTASVADLFHDALMSWPLFSKRFVEGDEAWLAAAIDNINYYGRISPAE